MSDKHIDDTPNIVLKKHVNTNTGYKGPSKDTIAKNDFSEIYVPPKNDNISKKLRELRCARGESQEVFCKALNITKKELNLIESGKLIPDNNKLQQLNNKLNRLRFLKK